MSNLKPIDQTVATPYWEALGFILSAERQRLENILSEIQLISDDPARLLALWHDHFDDTVTEIDSHYFSVVFPQMEYIEDLMVDIFNLVRVAGKQIEQENNQNAI